MIINRMIVAKISVESVLFFCAIIAASCIPGIAFAAEPGALPGLAERAAQWLDIASKVIAGAAVIAAALPVPAGVTSGLGLARKLIDALAFNFGHAANRK